MSAQLKRQDLDQVQDQVQQVSPQFQEFQELNSNSAKFRELVFFARISVFCLSTVLTAFLLLTSGVSALYTFPLAMLVGLAITSTLTYFIIALNR